MEQHKKIIILGIAIMLLLAVAGFVFAIVNYDPPKREITKERNDGYMEADPDLDADGASQEMADSGLYGQDETDPQEISDTVPADNYRPTNYNSNYGSILVRVRSRDNLPVERLICQLSVVNDELMVK